MLYALIGFIGIVAGFAFGYDEGINLCPRLRRGMQCERLRPGGCQECGRGANRPWSL